MHPLINCIVIVTCFIIGALTYRKRIHKKIKDLDDGLQLKRYIVLRDLNNHNNISNEAIKEQNSVNHSSNLRSLDDLDDKISNLHDFMSLIGMNL